MFKKSKPVVTKTTASHLAQNLAACKNKWNEGTDFAYVHKSSVQLLLSGGHAPTGGEFFNVKQVTCKLPTADQASSSVSVMQAKWVDLADRRILVLATSKGIQLYEGDGSTMLFWHSLSGGDPAVQFTKGICGFGRNTLCIGTSSGEIQTFTIPDKGNNVMFVSSLQGHTAPVCAVECSTDGRMLASSDDAGTVIIWTRDHGEHFSLQRSLKSPSYPCVGLALWSNLVVAVYGDGILRVFDVNSGQLLAEASAHSRWINSVHMAQDKGWILTVSDDSAVRVWQLSVDSEVQLAPIFTDFIENVQLVGAQFRRNDGKEFVVSGYDSPSLYAYSLV